MLWPRALGLLKVNQIVRKISEVFKASMQDITSVIFKSDLLKKGKWTYVFLTSLGNLCIIWKKTINSRYAFDVNC